MAASRKSLADAIRRFTSSRATRVVDPQALGLAQRLPGVAQKLSGQAHSLGGQARSLGGQARSLPSANDLPGQSAGLPGSAPSPIIAIERSPEGLVVHISPVPSDGRNAEQRFPDTRQGHAVAGRYAAELSHATKLKVNDLTSGGRHHGEL